MSLPPIPKIIKTLCQLGVARTGLYALYRLGLVSGHYRRVTPPRQEAHAYSPGLPPIKRFPVVSDREQAHAAAEAEVVLNGQMPYFGGSVHDINLAAGQSAKHWSILERQPPDTDIKWIWEPGRFGWAICLARAYAFTQNQAYSRKFWDNTLAFLDYHPPNLGRQWQSGQEVALRLMALVFCDRVFASSPASTPAHRQRLWQAIAEHALRLPPTLVYARSQNNNHLLSEAAGLYTAGVYLPEHPLAANWRKSGWRWLNIGFQAQINAEGAYIQHSVNYHRLMLQLALYADWLRRSDGDWQWPELTRQRLAAATRWLWALTDAHSGQTPNLGANDGAYFLPLTDCPPNDYRPVVQAGGRAFLNLEIYPDPHLSEMASWLDLAPSDLSAGDQPQASDYLRVEGKFGRAFLHATNYSDRPSHADQLHLDLWWRGVNVAQDPGTYAYNAPPPWTNALTATQVHNTLTIDGQDQMTRAGRFLWLDWAQAAWIARETDPAGQMTRLVAEHDGYRKLDLTHQRTLTATSDGWLVTDLVLPSNNRMDRRHRVDLIYNLPDWDWQLSGHRLVLTGPDFPFTVQIEGGDQVGLFRSGAAIYGEMPAHPSYGWVAPAYGVKIPTLMLRVSVEGRLPLTLTTHWIFQGYI